MKLETIPKAIRLFDDRQRLADIIDTLTNEDWTIHGFDLGPATAPDSDDPEIAQAIVDLYRAKLARVEADIAEL